MEVISRAARLAKHGSLTREWTVGEWTYLVPYGQLAIEQWTLEAESRVRGGNVTVLPGSRLVAQTMRLRVPACVGCNSCPYTLARVLRLSCP